MNAFQKKITLRVLGIHAAIIFLVAIVPLMQSCFQTKPKELITFIEFGPPMENVPTETVSHMPDPAPPPPDPTPVEIPDPTPPPREVTPTPTPKVPTPKDPPKPRDPPKPTYTRPEDIQIGKVVKATPKTPRISDRDIREALDDITESTPSPTSGSPDLFKAYGAEVFKIFKNAWIQPASPGARPAKVRISFSKSGRITGRVMIQKSGDTTFDRSVMTAVNSVSLLPKPPPGYPDSSVVVQFRFVN